MSGSDKNLPPEKQVPEMASALASTDGIIVVNDLVTIGDLPITSILGGKRIETLHGDILLVQDAAQKNQLRQPEATQTPALPPSTAHAGIAAGASVKRARRATVESLSDDGGAEPSAAVSSNQALERIAHAVQLNLGQLQLNMDKARQESSQFFRGMFLFIIAGVGIILIAVVLMLAHLVEIGMVTAAASLIPQIGAILVFKKDSELRRTIEMYHNHVLESQGTLTMIDLAETIYDPKTKDSVKEQIIFRIFKLKTGRQNTESTRAAK